MDKCIFWGHKGVCKGMISIICTHIQNRFGLFDNWCKGSKDDVLFKDVTKAGVVENSHILFTNVQCTRKSFDEHFIFNDHNL